MSEQELRQLCRCADPIRCKMAERIRELQAELVDFKDSHADEWMKRIELEEDVTLYKKRIAELEDLLREFVACATALGNGEMLCKVEDSLVTKTRQALGAK